MKWIKRLWQNTKKGYQRYVVLTKRIDKYVTITSMIKATLGSLVITLFIVSIPVLVIVNMFIYAKLTLLLAIILLVVIMGGVYVYFNFYYVLLKNYHPKLEDVAYRLPQYIESTMVTLVILMIGIVVISVIL